MQDEVEASDVTKKKIKFRIEDSLKRRNVDKHIVRVTTLNYTKLKPEIIRQYAQYGLDEDRYQVACKLLEGVREYVQGKLEGGQLKSSCDYAQTVNVMLRSLELRLAMRCSIEKSLRDIRESRSKRVKEANRECYTVTLEDYIEYIDNLRGSSFSTSASRSTSGSTSGSGSPFFSPT